MIGPSVCIRCSPMQRQPTPFTISPRASRNFIDIKLITLMILRKIQRSMRDRFYLGNIAGYRVLCSDGSILQVQEEPGHAGAVGDTVWCLFTSELAWIIRR
jgi:hypothetical protein